MDERDFMEANKCIAKNEKAADGRQPIAAHFLADAMSSNKGNTTKVGGGKFRHAKVDIDTQLENRVMAVEVVCGPLEYTSLFHSHDIIAGGANYMVQVLKLALEELDEKLQEIGFVLPREIYLQFDNSGENKNKVMFAYISALIELIIFDVIHVNFLIVGHTHCSVDQLFGSFSDGINGSKFIASPPALWKLLEKTRPDRVFYHHQVISVYDWTSFLHGIINHKIEGYSFPFNFKFTRSKHGKAIFFYRLYKSKIEWLPSEPTLPSDENEERSLVEMIQDFSLSNITTNSLFIVEDEKSFHKSVGANVTSSLECGDEKLAILNNVNHLRNEFLELEKNALNQQLQRHRDEADSSVIPFTIPETSNKVVVYTYKGQPRYQTNAKEMMKLHISLSSNSKDGAGYLFFLESSIHDLHTKTPKLVHPKELIEHLLDNTKVLSPHLTTAKIALEYNITNKLVGASTQFRKNIIQMNRFEYRIDNPADFVYDKMEVTNKDIEFWFNFETKEKVLKWILADINKMPEFSFLNTKSSSDPLYAQTVKMNRDVIESEISEFALKLQARLKRKQVIIL